MPPPAPPRSRWKRAAAFLAVLVLVAGAAAVLVRRSPAPLTSVRRPVLFVGLDGADWQLLDGYMASGAMPTLARLVREGRSGVLTTIHPPLSPLVWTTMMTGVSPLEHGILDFTRFSPQTGAREPITSDERRVPAVWTLAGAASRRVAVLGLWATYPAEPVRGLLVSDRLFSFQRAEQAPAEGLVFPPERDGWARAARARAEAEVDEAAVRAYLPWLDDARWAAARARPDPWSDPVTALQRILIETRVYDALARDWLASQPTDLAIVYFQGTDAIGHVFAPYAAPRLPDVPEADFERYSSVPELYFREIDRILAGYAAWAEANQAVLMVASDHGFFWSEGRPRAASSLATASAGRWHRDDGIYVLWNSRLAPSGAHDGHGSVTQVAATLLGLLGAPSEKDMARPPLAGVAESAILREGGPLPRPSAATGSAVDPEQVEKLRALGYVGGSEPSSRSAGSTSTRTAGSYNNEGLIRRERGESAEAEAAFRQALVLDPQLPSAQLNLSDLRLAAGDRDAADALLIDALRAGAPDAASRIAARATAYRRGPDAADRAQALLDRALDAAPAAPALWLSRGRGRIDAGECEAALSDFARAARLAPADALPLASSGLAHLCLGHTRDAARDFERSLALDPGQPQVRAALDRLRAPSPTTP